MNKTYLVELSGRAILYHNGEEIDLTSYWHVDKDWVYDYLRQGGQDSPFKGPLSNRIYIGDREFEYIRAVSHLAHKAYQDGGVRDILKLKPYER